MAHSSPRLSLAFKWSQLRFYTSSLMSVKSNLIAGREKSYSIPNLPMLKRVSAKSFRASPTQAESLEAAPVYQPRVATCATSRITMRQISGASRTQQISDLSGGTLPNRLIATICTSGNDSPQRDSEEDRKKRAGSKSTLGPLSTCGGNL